MHNLVVYDHGRGRHDAIAHYLGDILDLLEFDLYALRLGCLFDQARVVMQLAQPLPSTLIRFIVFPQASKLKPQPTSVIAMANTPANRASPRQWITLRRISISGSDSAAILIMKARVVPIATPLASIASATGITPVALE